MAELTPEERQELLASINKYNDNVVRARGPEVSRSLQDSKKRIADLIERGGGDKTAVERYLSGKGADKIDPAQLASAAKIAIPIKIETPPPPTVTFAPPNQAGDSGKTETPKPDSNGVVDRSGGTSAKNGGANGALGGLGDVPPGDGRLWLQGDMGVPLGEESVGTLKGFDAVINNLMNADFDVDPGEAWFTTGARLRGGNGNNVNPMWGTSDKIMAAQKRIDDLFTKLLNAYKANGDTEEEQFTKEYNRVAATLNDAKTASTKLGEMGPKVREFGDAANHVFHEYRGRMRNTRKDVGIKAEGAYNILKGKSESERKAYIEGWNKANFNLFADVKSPPEDKPHGPVTAAREAMGKIRDSIKTVEGKPKAEVTVPHDTKPDAPGGKTNPTTTAGGGGPSAGARTPGGGAPGKGTPSPGKETPGGSPSKEKPSSKIDPNTLLQALQGAGQQPQQATPQQQSQTPQMPTMPQTGQGQQNPLAQTTPQQQKQLADLLNGVKPEAEKKPDVDKPQFDSTPAGKAAEKDAPAPGSPIGTATPASPNGDPKTGEQPRKHQLDSTGTPVDRNKDGKVDKGAIPMSELTRRPFEMKLDVSPDLSIKLDDARLGEVMLNLEDGTPDDPKSVIEALREAGINVDELGDEVDPKDIREGDTVVSEKGSGMYIGDDKVLMGTGEVKPLQELLDANGKVYETPLPDLPKEVDLTQDQRDALTAHDNGQARPNDQHQVPAVDPATGKPIGEQGAVGGDQPAKPGGDNGQGGGQPPQGQQDLGEDGKPKPPPGAPAPGEPGGPQAGEQPSTPPAQQTQTDTAAKPDSGGSQPGAGQPAQQPNAPVAGPPPSSAYVPQGDDAKVQPQQPAAEQPKDSDGPQQRPFRGYAVG